MGEKQLQAREFFDDKLASELIGKRLLVGITHQNSEGAMLRRTQLVGHVTVADRNRGICIRDDQNSQETRFPPDTRGITPARPGEYRNRTTGEVVKDPEYLASWRITAPAATPSDSSENT